MCRVLNQQGNGESELGRMLRLCIIREYVPFGETAIWLLAGIAFAEEEGRQREINTREGNVVGEGEPGRVMEEGLYYSQPCQLRRRMK